MKRKKSKILALLLCFCMIFATSGVVYADEEVPESSGNAEIVSEENGSTEAPLEEGEIEGASEPEDAEQSLSEEDEEMSSEETEDTNGLLTDYPVMGVDENGNVFEIEIEEGSGVVGSVMTRSRTISPMIVNFAANANDQSVTGITEYTEYLTGQNGYTYGHAGADAAYLGTENGKVKFMLSGVIGLVDESKVQVVRMSNVKSFSYYSGNGSNLLHHVSTDMSTPGTAFSVNIGPQPSYIQTGTSYYSYDGHYFYTDYSVMLSDYTSDTRSNSVNANNPYYNYFQYLPLRSTTSYSGSTLNTIINKNASSSSKMYNTGNTFVEKQNTYGTNALIMTSAGALESGWGTSYIAQMKNNLFGL
ncbi:MAG: glucosaminidase domain-containing protein, partial [Ruminococcus sp.]|nr:glucosaminidase domain-containing protein [Ruminococcus sp.]